jgi:glyoxylase-like metal-dependent hydrolase (beta-lactamase superfamily II)/rhodanese-related sulfurtransferase
MNHDGDLREPTIGGQPMVTGAAPLTAPLALVNEGLGNSSYLVDLGDGRALAIDPERDPDPYLAAAESRGLTITLAAETHLHADFVSGSRELAAHGAQVLAPAAGGTGFGHRGLHDGDELDLGGLRLRALATPGHTPEHMAYLLLDGDRPAALFSGGSLLVGAVARTDLIAPERAGELARALWRSLHERILTLPDDLPVYPTHGAGSFCAAPASAERTTTIGAQRAANPLLAAPSEDEFVRLLLDGLGTYPPYFLRLREVNRRGPAVLGPPAGALPALTPGEVRRLAGAGTGLIDARPAASFAAGHIPGAISIPLRPAFATWLGWLTDPGRPAVFVLEPGQDRAGLIRQARSIGYEHLAGELAGGMAAWAAAGLPVRQISVVRASEVTGPVLDVRQAAEYSSGHLPDARHIELGALTSAEPEPGPGPGPEPGPGARPVTLMCGAGDRAMTAASLLARRGHPDLAVAVGGPGDWAAAHGQPLETGP